MCKIYRQYTYYIKSNTVVVLRTNITETFCAWEDGRNVTEGS